MRDLGVLYGGYSNDYRLEDAITRDEFLPMLQTLAETVVSSPNDTILEEQEESLTCGEIVYMVENTLQLRPNGTTLQDIDVLTEQLQPYFAEVDKVPNRAEVVMLLANAYQYQQQRAAESNE
jgi:hypothetical protein